jgi:aryl-alcohol dehydrogenase-like predicted oxidoreductase
VIQKLILGTAQLGLDYGINNQKGKPSLEKSFEILDNAFDSGIETLDTALGYGDSHTVIGKYHRRNPQKRFKVITKFGSYTGHTEFLEDINKSCLEIGVKQLLGTLFHDIEGFRAYSKSILTSEIAQLEKKCGAVGVSVYTNEEIEELLTFEVIPKIVQIPFNVLDNATQKGDLIKRLKEKGIIIHSRSAFLQGLFFMEENKIPSKLKSLSSVIKNLKEAATSEGVSWESYLFNYPLSKRYIDGCIFGVENESQVLANVQLLDTKSINYQFCETILVDSDLLNPSKWKIQK